MLADLNGCEILALYCTRAEILIGCTITSFPKNFHIFSAKHGQETEFPGGNRPISVIKSPFINGFLYLLSYSTTRLWTSTHVTAAKFNFRNGKCFPYVCQMYKSEGCKWTGVGQYRFRSTKKAITAALLRGILLKLMRYRLVIITDVLTGCSAFVFRD